MNDFNADAERLKLYFWVAIISLVLLAHIIWGSTALISIPFCIILLFLRPWQYTISKAYIVTQRLEVTKRNWLLGSKSYNFDLAQIDFIYRTKLLRISRGLFGNTIIKGNVLMVFNDEPLLFDLTPNEGGWTDASIRQFAADLKAHGVKQILEKYSTDDVLL
jgi:hypothetical protein